MSEAIYSPKVPQNPQEVTELTKNLKYILVDKTGYVTTIKSLKSKNENRYYVYLLIDPRNWIPFYAGKGCNDRCRSHLRNKKTDKNYNKRNKIQKILNLGLKIIIMIVESDLYEQSALLLEESLILSYGRILTNDGPLTNLCTNSNPVSSYVGGMPKETKDKISGSLKGYKPICGFAKGELNPMYGKRGELSPFYGKPVSEKAVIARFEKLAKSYIITSPNGRLFTVKGLKGFCRDNNLNPGAMYQVANKKLNQHKGYTCDHLS